VERLAWGGKGVARAEDGRLLLLEAPLALFPGEAVEAEVHWKARHGEGRVLRWTRKDPQRGPAGCPMAGTCGGCELWESGEAQGDLKRQMVADLFRRQLGDPAFSWHPAPPEARRHRIQLHWDGAHLGFHRRNSHAVVPVTACPAAAMPLSEAIPRMLDALEGGALPRRSQRWELATGEPAGTVFATDESGRSWRLEPDGFRKTEDPILERVAGAALRHGPGGFFQVSPAWAAQAFGGLLERWKIQGSTLFDLYGGVGLFSALLKDRFKRFLLVESFEPAVAWARKNLAELGLDAECCMADVAEWVEEGLGRPEDLILLDPPRAGLAPELSAKLLSAKTDRMVLVGCDGAAFCRDLKRLEEAWKVEQLAALDLFPLTHHVECVALLKRV
jgi:23S rRNA (uracil1939-C5)-methyltransferase